jgi:hypothetical protein
MQTYYDKTLQDLRRQTTLDAHSDAMNRYISRMEQTVNDLSAELFAARITMAVALAAMFLLVWTLFGRAP